MPLILTTNAVITCPHGGLGITTPSDPKWTINGGFVTLENDVGVLSCPFLPLPCGGYQLTSMGLNATQIDGRKVMLVTDFNVSFTGLPLSMQETHQTIDQSTPAPIPAGGDALPLSPELADMIPPVVVAPVAAFPFVSTAPTPAPVVIAFSLTGDHPMQWQLTLISESQKKNYDLTNGIPSQVTVAPQGGQWTAPSLTVTVTFTPTFLISLGIGLQDVFLTGVSQRGLSSHAKAVITVS